MFWLMSMGVNVVFMISQMLPQRKKDKAINTLHYSFPGWWSSWPWKLSFRSSFSWHEENMGSEWSCMTCTAWRISLLAFTAPFEESQAFDSPCGCHSSLCEILGIHRVPCFCVRRCFILWDPVSVGSPVQGFCFHFLGALKQSFFFSSGGGALEQIQGGAVPTLLLQGSRDSVAVPVPWAGYRRGQLINASYMPYTFLHSKKKGNNRGS